MLNKTAKLLNINKKQNNIFYVINMVDDKNRAMKKTMQAVAHNTKSK